MESIKHEVLAALHLPRSVHAQALKLLTVIANASTVAETPHEANRAEGFTLGIETVKALHPG